MAINSEVIIWTCVTVAVLVGICAIVLIAMSSRNMKKNREAMRDLQGAIKVGARIMFAGCLLYTSRYVITSNGAMVTDVKEKKTLFRALIKKEDALSILSDCRKEKFGIAAHVRHRYFAQESFLLRQAALFTGKMQRRFAA